MDHSKLFILDGSAEPKETKRAKSESTKWSLNYEQVTHIWECVITLKHEK